MAALGTAHHTCPAGCGVPLKVVLETVLVPPSTAGGQHAAWIDVKITNRAAHPDCFPEAPDGRA